MTQWEDPRLQKLGGPVSTCVGILTFISRINTTSESCIAK